MPVSHQPSRLEMAQVRHFEAQTQGSALPESRRKAASDELAAALADDAAEMEVWNAFTAEGHDGFIRTTSD